MSRVRGVISAQPGPMKYFEPINSLVFDEKLGIGGHLFHGKGTNCTGRQMSMEHINTILGPKNGQQIVAQQETVTNAVDDEQPIKAESSQEIYDRFDASSEEPLAEVAGEDGDLEEIVTQKKPVPTGKHAVDFPKLEIQVLSEIQAAPETAFERIDGLPDINTPLHEDLPSDLDIPPVEKQIQKTEGAGFDDSAESEALGKACVWDICDMAGRPKAQEYFQVVTFLSENAMLFGVRNRTGKWDILKGVLKAQLNNDKSRGNASQDMISARIDKRGKVVFGPPMKSEYVIYVEDMHLPQIMKCSPQDHTKLLGERMDPCQSTKIIDTKLCGSIGAPGVAQDTVTNRFSGHFNIISSAEMPSEAGLRIFSTISPNKSFHEGIQEMCNKVQFDIYFHPKIRRDECHMAVELIAVKTRSKVAIPKLDIRLRGIKILIPWALHKKVSRILVHEEKTKHDEIAIEQVPADSVAVIVPEIVTSLLEDSDEEVGFEDGFESLVASAAKNPFPDVHTSTICHGVHEIYVDNPSGVVCNGNLIKWREQMTPRECVFPLARFHVAGGNIEGSGSEKMSKWVLLPA
ncbi:hypothetical protein BSKO_05779 [Bryopsis sp. KO-2023]|nr:hypothetical protein BSKO_05779 [Bryopsis sp. KO-2023]